MTASSPMCRAAPEVVMEVYYEWCRWLELPHELPPIVMERLGHGGEYLRSLLQFMLRSSEPHCLEMVMEMAEWRSQMAMHATCMALTTGFTQSMTLATTCLELLGGLQPGCSSSSLHICTVLQHLLIAHEPEVLTLLLHYQAPFVLLRALNRPGCSEILQIMLGSDAMLPKVVPHLPTRQLHVHSLQQVRQYLLAFQWPKCLEAVMAHGAAQSSAKTRESLRTPPGTPVTFHSPGAAWLDEAKVTPCSTPQRTQGTPEATPFQSLEAKGSSPSTEAARQPCLQTPPKVMFTPPRSGSKQEHVPGSPEDPAPGGVAVLLGFLSSILHAFKRSDQVAERSLSRGEDWESQERAKVQVLLLRDFFIDVPLVSSLCLLIGREFESASLLSSLLLHALHIHSSQPAMVDALAGQCLQRLDSVVSALGLNRSLRASSRNPREASQGSRGRGKEALRLNGYVVQEPLGALRVEVVQILSALSRLAPERFLPLVKPQVWSALAKWFFIYRCNHIFQAACGKLWVEVIHFGSPQLQYNIFMHLRLFSGLCDAVLTEGTNPRDRWHDLARKANCVSDRVEKREVTTCRSRHPGGLGTIVQVLRALADAVEATPAERRPLAEKVPDTQVSAKIDTKPEESKKTFLKKMVSASTLWPQVLKALPPRSPAAPSRIVAVPAARTNSAPFDI